MAVVFQVGLVSIPSSKALTTSPRLSFAVHGKQVRMRHWSGYVNSCSHEMAFFNTIIAAADLATHCRLLLYNRPKHPRLYRWLLLYPLYALCEIAIISTDLAELLGSATALVLLFPSLPLWAGVLITCCDVFIVLAFCSPEPRSRPQRVFEFLVIALVLAVFIPLAIVIGEVRPNWAKVFDGYLPSSTVFQPGALYTCTCFHAQRIPANSCSCSYWHHWRHGHAAWSFLGLRTSNARSRFRRSLYDDRYVEAESQRRDSPWNDTAWAISV